MGKFRGRFSLFTMENIENQQQVAVMGVRKRSCRARRFSIVLNNPTGPEKTILEVIGNEIRNKPTRVKYLIWQLEEGKDGTPHVQGYIEFINQRTLHTVKSYLGSIRYHVEVARTSSVFNTLYCSKEEGRLAGPYASGVSSSPQGYRSDIDVYDEVRDLLHSEGLTAVSNSHFDFFLRHHGGLRAYQGMRLQALTRTERTRLRVVLGPPGTGKTVLMEGELANCAYWKEPNHMWWDGYDPQVHTHVVIDEFVGQIPLTSLNRLLGSSPTSVKIHGGMIPFLAKEIVIISNLRPQDWWRNIRIPLASLFRRIDEVWRLDSYRVVVVTKNTLLTRQEPCEEICEAASLGI